MMKSKPMKTDKSNYRKNLGLGLIFLAAVLSAACGSKIIRGAAPMVRMTELAHQDNKITLQISMRNPNGVPLDIQTIDFSLSASDKQLFTYQGALNSRNLLDKLESGEVKSLPYSLKGSVFTRDDGSLFFEYEGHIYPLPGRPGHFR